MPTIHMKGHEQVTASLQLGAVADQLDLKLTDDRIDDLSWALNRALNCSPDAPKWLFELADMCDARKVMP